MVDFIQNAFTIYSIKRVIINHVTSQTTLDSWAIFGLLTKPPAGLLESEHSATLGTRLKHSSLFIWT